MHDITFITSNQGKVDYLSKYLGINIKHQKIDLIEIQSLNLQEVVEHKVKQAYQIVNSPVLVEDVSLEFKALGKLPGTFIKYYINEVPFETICRTLDGMSRKALARCMFGYYDGNKINYFEGSLKGLIAEHPAGNNGYGWDKIFIPEGYNVTRASLNEKDDELTYTKIKPFAQLRNFLESM
jgi:non-canonical purine NTP pyrophosphatase (RdgB/HAM1 family)